VAEATAGKGIAPGAPVEIWFQDAGGAHAVITLDKAGWHTTRKLQVPSNISLVHLPPACPELNPTENLLQYLRQGVTLR
jgi:hypothetical protein